jgi:hypothetical protein
MSQANLALPDWAEQLAGLVLLAGCAAMAMPVPQPKVNVLPSVEADSLAERKRRKDKLSPEVREFMELTPDLQKLALSYVRNWIAANYEREG